MSEKIILINDESKCPINKIKKKIHGLSKVKPIFSKEISIFEMICYGKNCFMIL